MSRRAVKEMVGPTKKRGYNKIKSSKNLKMLMKNGNSYSGAGLINHVDTLFNNRSRMKYICTSNYISRSLDHLCSKKSTYYAAYYAHHVILQRKNDNLNNLSIISLEYIQSLSPEIYRLVQTYCAIPIQDTNYANQYDILLRIGRALLHLIEVAEQNDDSSKGELETLADLTFDSFHDDRFKSFYSALRSEIIFVKNQIIEATLGLYQNPTSVEPISEEEKEFMQDEIPIEENDELSGWQESMDEGIGGRNMVKMTLKATVAGFAGPASPDHHMDPAMQYLPKPSAFSSQHQPDLKTKIYLKIASLQDPSLAQEIRNILENCESIKKLVLSNNLDGFLERLTAIATINDEIEERKDRDSQYENAAKALLRLLDNQSL
jgi:hypothetical protein